MNAENIADRVVQSIVAARTQPDDFPSAAIVVGSKRVEFRIQHEAHGKPATGSEPYGNQPLKAIRRVLDLVEKHGVPEKNVDIIT